MAYYFSYDALIPDYIEELGFYNKEQLHCTLAYSKDEFSEQYLDKLHLLNIPKQQLAIVTGIAILNNHITLLIDNPHLKLINKNILSQFSIVEDYSERLMHVSIKKNLIDNSVSLKLLEDKYCGKQIVLNQPKLFIYQKDSQDKEIISLDTTITSNKRKFKY